MICEPVFDYGRTPAEWTVDEDRHTADATGADLGFRPNEMGCHNTPAAEDIERLRAIYDSDISYDDQQLGKLIAQLKKWNLWDQTLLIVTADHGDELFEDERCGHGGSLLESLIHVPLLVHDPARFPEPAASRRTAAVALVFR